MSSTSTSTEAFYSQLPSSPTSTEAFYVQKPTSVVPTSTEAFYVQPQKISISTSTEAFYVQPKRISIQTSTEAFYVQQIIRTVPTSTEAFYIAPVQIKVVHVTIPESFLFLSIPQGIYSALEMSPSISITFQQSAPYIASIKINVNVTSSNVTQVSVTSKLPFEYQLIETLLIPPTIYYGAKLILKLFSSKKKRKRGEKK